MIADSIIIGGGPAGLNAALVLGRAKRRVTLFDDNQPRNAVTQESHGFLTRDGINPEEFRDIAHREIGKYPSVEIRPHRVTNVCNREDAFEVVVGNGEMFHAKTIILATGLKEKLPDVEGIHAYYGKSLFSCPYCDGWERRDQPLVLISEGEHTFHMAKTIWNWSHDLLVCTNGHHVLTEEQQKALGKKGIQLVEDRITALAGEDGYLEGVVFASQEERSYASGFVATQWFQASPFGTQLGCDLNPFGGILIDQFGRTTVPGIYAAGETLGQPSQLITSAAEGSRAAAGVNTDLIEREFRS